MTIKFVLSIWILVCLCRLVVSQQQVPPSTLAQIYRKDYMQAAGAQKTEREVNSHEVSVCRGHMRSITCPNLELLHIYNAFYGKLSGHDCEVPITQFRDQMPTCFSKDAPDIIRQSCQGQQSCDLYAEDSLYSNPCPSVRKYLFVSFTCQGRSRLPEILKLFQQQQAQRRQFLITQQQLIIKKQQQEKEQGLRRQQAQRREGVQRRTQQLQQILQRNSTPQFQLGQKKNLQSTTLIRGNVPQRPSYTPYQEALLQARSEKYAQEYLQRGNVHYMQPIKYQPQRQVKYLPAVKYSNLQHQLAPELATMNEAQLNDANGLLQRLPLDAARLMHQSPMLNVPRYAMPGGNGDMWQSKPDVRFYQDQVSAALNSLYNLYTNRKCDQCDGNCRNYLCYGCGGCSNPPAEQQTYYYPYQRQDAEYHDAFENNAMALSGLVLYPFPKRIKHLKKRQKVPNNEDKGGSKSSKLASIERRSSIIRNLRRKEGSRHRRNIDMPDMWEVMYEIT